MEGAVRDAALAEVAVSAVRIRGVHVIPVRHHSPAIARATAAVIRALRPRLVLIEGPSDANHLIGALTAPDAVAPLAILAYRQPQALQASADLAPQVVFYPLCDYSPELVALRTAAELGIEARFCDIPASAVLEQQGQENTESSQSGNVSIQSSFVSFRTAFGTFQARLGRFQRFALTPSPSPTAWARGAKCACCATRSPSPATRERGQGGEGQSTRAVKRCLEACLPSFALTPSPSPTAWARGAKRGRSTGCSPSPASRERGQGVRVEKNLTLSLFTELSRCIPVRRGQGVRSEKTTKSPPSEPSRCAAFRTCVGDKTVSPYHNAADSPAQRGYGSEVNLYARVAQQMGFEDHEEWWECLFETALRDPSALLERTFEWGQLVVGETGVSDYDALRNAYMWKQVEESGVPPEQIVLVVGAAHAAAFADPNFRAEYDSKHPLLQARPAEFVLTPYSFPRLSEQLGYGAGNRAPQFYQDAWEFGSLEDATLATLTRLVNSMKLQGDVASHADAIEAFRLAKQLATLRGKPQPGYRETVDAAVAAFGRGQAERVELPLKRLMIGERIGRAPQSETQPPVQAEFYRLAHELRIPVKDDPTDLRLNLAEPHAVQQSIFLHRLAVAKIPFADLQSGEAATYGQMARLREKWRLQWTPLTDVALTEASIYGDTLREVAKRKIAPRLAQREQLAQVSAAALEAVLCELPELYDTALQALDEASVRDGGFVSLAWAAYQIAGLIEYGAARAVQQAMFEPLLQRVYTRACLHLLPASDCGDDEARQVGEGMQLLHELAHKLPYLEGDLWRENLREMVLSERAHAYVVGVGLGLLGFVRTEDEDLWLRAQRMLSPATPPEQAASFLEGLLHAQGGAAARARPFVQAMHEFVMSLPDEQFIQALPMLRRAFSKLSNHDIHYLTDNLLRLLGLEQGAQPPAETEVALTREEVEQIWAQLAWLETTDLAGQLS